MARKRQTMTNTELLQLVALSLGTEELRTGLDMMLSLALQKGTDVEDWDQLKLMGYEDYEIECTIAAAAWIKRVTGMDEFSRVITLQRRDEKK